MHIYHARPIHICIKYMYNDNAPLPNRNAVSPSMHRRGIHFTSNLIYIKVFHSFLGVYSSVSIYSADYRHTGVLWSIISKQREGKKDEAIPVVLAAFSPNERRTKSGNLHAAMNWLMYRKTNNNLSIKCILYLTAIWSANKSFIFIKIFCVIRKENV